MSSGVMSEPPPTPVMPTRTPTPRPNTMISGSMRRSPGCSRPWDPAAFGRTYQLSDSQCGDLVGQEGGDSDERRSAPPGNHGRKRFEARVDGRAHPIEEGPLGTRHVLHVPQDHEGVELE